MFEILTAVNISPRDFQMVLSVKNDFPERPLTKTI